MASSIDSAASFLGVGSYAAQVNTQLDLSRERLPIRPVDRGGGGFAGLNAAAAAFVPTGSATANEMGRYHAHETDLGVGSQETGTGETWNNSKSRKKRKSQARRDRWGETATERELKVKYREFNKGVKSFQRKIRPTFHQLSNALVRGHIDSDTCEVFTTKDVKFAALHGENGGSTDQREMERLVELLQDGGVGYLPEKKKRGWIRLMFENWNSLGIFTHSWKVGHLNYLIKSLSIDIVCGCEAQVDWTFVDRGRQFLDIIAPGLAKKGICSHNSTERIAREQVGGTCIATLGRLCDVTSEVGADPTGLGRFSWVTLSDGGKWTWVVVAYIPCKPGKNSRGKTRWEQEERYFLRRGDNRYPLTIMIEDLLRHIREWRLAGEEVLLALDANQDVYDGTLGMALSHPPFDMGCMMEQATGSRVPNSHHRGHVPISTIYGSKGIQTGDGMVYPHFYGIGDHRVFVLEVSAESLFGGDYPSVGRPNSRILNCRIDRVRRKYCRILKALTDRHRMFEKLKRLEALDDTVGTADYQLMHNKWDNELGDFMASAEHECNKLKSCAIEYSPTVGLWIKRRSILKWLLRWHDGKVPDSRNLVRAAERNGINNPLELTREEVEVHLVECIRV